MDNDRMRSLDPDVLERAWKLQQEGVMSQNSGQPMAAAERFRAGLTLTGWDEDGAYDGDADAARVTARLLISLAYPESDLGRTQLGLELLDRAENLVAEQDRQYLLNQRGVLLNNLGRVHEAIEEFNCAEPLLEERGPVWLLAGMLGNRAWAHGFVSQFQNARKDLQRAVKLATEHDVPLIAAKALHNRGLLELDVGDVPSALAALDEARRLYEKHAPNLVPNPQSVHAQALYSVGLFRQAEVVSDEAIEGMERQRRYRPLATIEFNRAEFALGSDDFVSAIRWAERAELRAKEQGNQDLAASAELVRLRARFELGERGERFADECAELAARLRNLNWEYWKDLADMLAARAYIACGQREAAESLLKRPIAGWAIEKLLARMTRRLAKAELAVHTGKPSALAQLRAGLGILNEYRSRFGSLEIQAGVSSIGRRLSAKGLSLSLESRRPTTVLSWSERARAQAYRVPPVTPPDDSEAAKELAQLRQARNELREAEMAGDATEESRARCRQLERQLRERAWQAAGPGETNAEVNPQQIHGQLSTTDHAMVSFVGHQGQLHALTLVDGKTKHHFLGDLPAVEEGTRRLAADLDVLTGRQLPERMAKTVQSSIQRLTDELTAALFAPLMKRLGDRDLVIVPTSLLASLPWGLLPPLRGRPVSVAPSASVWWSAAQQRAAASGQPLLALGPDLVHAETETDKIAACYPEATVLRGPDATAAATLEALDGAPIAHLAAHGHHESENVLFSRLDFADGPLMAYDIARLSAPPAHVTLSACDVGRSNVAVGDETLGFTAALLYSGTATVVSSVARIAHEAAADIMTAYHEQLTQGQSPARALAEASTRQPLSPFICYGAG